MTYKISDWDGNVLELTPGEIIEKLIKEEDEYGNFFTSYTELARVCQIEGFPGISTRAIAVFSIRHEAKMLAQGIMGKRPNDDKETSAGDAEPVESVGKTTSNIIISHGLVIEDLNDFGDEEAELYEELEDHYKFDGEDEDSLSFFFNYLLSDPERSVKINLQKLISLLILNTVFHVNVEYDLTDEEYERSNIWAHEMSVEIWKIVTQTGGINIRALNLFIEKVYLELLYEALGADRVPAADVDEAIQAEEFYTIEQTNGTEIFWEAWRQAEAMSDAEAEAILEQKAWDDYINTVANNICAEVYPMWTIYTDEAIWWDDFEAGKYPKGW